jgi:integrase/recombinase XerD
VFKGFHRFLEVRKAAEIEAAFGVRLACPLDEFNAARHVSDDSPAGQAPPTPERVGAFFEFLKARIATARKYAPVARDYAVFRTLYHAAQSPWLPFRTARAACRTCHARSAHPNGRASPLPPTAIRRPRGCPCWTGWICCCAGTSTTCAGRFPDSAVLLCDESGGRMATATIRNRLRHLMTAEGRPEADWFSPHAMRRACATHNYERGVDLVAIQQLLGHWKVTSTMRYVRPSETFIEDAYQRAISATLSELTEQE